ncbi:5'-adenylylsulfate reductase-like 5 isoform X2 [Wolffia australiana]
MGGHLPRFLLVFVSALALFSLGRSNEESSTCPRLDELVMLESAMRMQCPSWIERYPVLEVSGGALDKELSHSGSNAYYAVLFYASWCPFSQTTRQLFDALNVLFPAIHHLAVEESSALPMYNVRSFPSIFLVNGTRRERFRGSKDLISLLLFYVKTTGLEPVTYLPGDYPFVLIKRTPNQAHLPTPESFPWREPYLVLSLLFLLLRALVFISPAVWAKVKSLWSSHVLNANWVVFGGWDRLLERLLLVVDLKRHLVKLRISEKRSLQRRAGNARAWASSLTTSVSIGESGPSRSAASSS